MLKICVASYVLLIWLELITFVTLLATYPLPIQAVDPLCTLWLAWGLQFLRGNWQIRIYVRHKFQRNRNFMWDINSNCDNGLIILATFSFYSYFFILFSKKKKKQTSAIFCQREKQIIVEIISASSTTAIANCLRVSEKLCSYVYISSSTKD